MKPFLLDFIYWFNYFILGYYTVANGVYLLLLAVAVWLIAAHLFRLNYGRYQESIHPSVAPPISVIIAAYNEESTIIDSVRSLTLLNYPDYEIIVVNDGSTDSTLERLIEGFSLQRRNIIYRALIPTAGVKWFYINPEMPNLVVVDKAHAGKADSLNVGINVSRSPYFCSVDADSILEKDALLRLMRPIIESPDRVRATGGIVRIVNGSVVDRGRLEEVRLPKDSLSRMQVVEYIRSFLFGRAGLSALNSLLVISGTFSMFHKRTVQAVGGYNSRTVTEDMELVVRLHKYLLDGKQQYHVSFVPDPICWTEAPRDFAMLRRQRRRWHLGLAESVYMYRKMLFRPRYKWVGFFALPYQLFIELLGPVIEFLGYFVVTASFILRIVNLEFFLLFLTMAILVGVFFSTGAILLEEITYRRYKKLNDLFTLLLYGVLENFGYRQLVAYWRTAAVCKFLFSKDKRWEVVRKSGFDAPPEKAVEAAQKLLAVREMRKIIIAVGIAVLSCTSAYALDAQDEIKKAAQDVAEENRAGDLKKLGDYYAGAGDYKNAGGYYISALRGMRNRLTLEERKRMAVVISWAGAFEEAAAEFESILAERPGDLEARLSYARVLSWMGRTGAALSEVESVLQKAPSDRDALLLKADILRWSGEGKKAREVYGGLLEGGEDFGARAGLVYQDLSEGDVKGAKEGLRLLKPVNPYEEKLLNEITEAVDNASRPVLNASFQYYNDSDFNQTRTYSVRYNFLFNNIMANLAYLHTDAADRIRNNEADSLSAAAEARVAWGARTGVGAGFTALSNRDNSVFPNWFMKIDAKISGADVTAALSRETLTDTAALIENGVRYTSLGLAATGDFEKLTVTGSYSYRSYSDDNGAHDLRIVPEYTLYQKDVKLKAGYKLRYLNYRRQSLGGYYDPDYYLSNEIYLNFSWERGRLGLTVEPYGGYQTSRRFGNADSGVFGGGEASLVYKLNKGLWIEADAEGGNSAIGTVAGYKYYQAGIKMRFMP